jgi:hypothetical protein
MKCDYGVDGRLGYYETESILLMSTGL